MKTIKQSLLITLSITIFIAGYVWAGEVPILKIFEKGTPAVADEVNNNFDVIKKEVNKNNDRITTNTSTIDDKQDRVTGTCPDGQYIRIINADGTVVCEKVNDLMEIAAYGVYTYSQLKRSSSNVSSCIYNSTKKRYEITFKDLAFSIYDYLTTVTLLGYYRGTPNVNSGDDGKLHIWFVNHEDGAQVEAMFSFIIFEQ